MPARWTWRSTAATSISAPTAARPAQRPSSSGSRSDSAKPLLMNDEDLSPRKLPRQLRAKETVDAIFTAAMQMLEKSEGASHPSVQAIADRAGVSVGSLYQYFSSK